MRARSHACKIAWALASREVGGVWSHARQQTPIPRGNLTFVPCLYASVFLVFGLCAAVALFVGLRVHVCLLFLW